mgnify:CR=1 FL=1
MHGFFLFKYDRQYIFELIDELLLEKKIQELRIVKELRKKQQARYVRKLCIYMQLAICTIYKQDETFISMKSRTMLLYLYLAVLVPVRSLNNTIIYTKGSQRALLLSPQ